MSDKQAKPKRPAQAKRRKGNWWRARAWHRWTGALFTIPLLWMAVSGFLLNHPERFGIDRKLAQSPWVLKRYGMVPEGTPMGVTVGTRHIAEWGGVLFLDRIMLEEAGQLVGSVGVKADLVIGTHNALYVYSPDGGLADVLDELSLPAIPVQRIGTSPAGGLAVEIDGAVWLASEDLLEFSEIEAEGVTWSTVAEVDSGHLEEALAAGAGIPWSRVVLDLHSGNIFGSAGRLLVDLTAIGLIVMTLFGVKLLFKGMR